MKRFFVFILTVLFVPVFYACSKPLEKTHYDIKVEYFEGSVRVDESIDFSAQTDNYDKAYFNFYPLAYQSGQKFSPVQNGEYAVVDILEISANKRKLEYTINDSFVEVSLGKKHSKGEKIKLHFKINIKLPNAEYRMAKTDKTVNLGNFFAMLAVHDENYIKCDYGVIGDPFVSEVADYNVSVTLPSTYVVAASGVPVSTDVGETKTMYSYEQKNVRDFAIVLSDKFEVKQEKWGNKSINYYFYDDMQAEKTIACVASALEFFSKTFGEYPYDIFSVCQTPFVNGGMEYPLLVYISDNLNYEDYLYALVHEIAHQWWYGLVGNNQIEESYLDEALAEYSAYLFFDGNKGYGIDGDTLVRNAATAVETCERAIFEVNGKFVPSVKKPISEFKSEYEYANMVYGKGFIMMKTLENLTNRKYVTGNLKTYFENNKYKIADTKDFLNAFTNDKPLLNSYLNGKTRVFL